MLSKNGEDIPHPRNRIKQDFEDGESCLVTLKDRSREQDEDEQLWYDRAFGTLRNMMRVKLHFNPPKEVIGDKQSKYEFHVRFKYTMFPELADEFNADDYPSIVMPLAEELDENENLEYLAEFDRPYGTYTVELRYKVKDTVEGDENFELQPLPEGKGDAFLATHEPMPISETQQKQFDEEEEKQNKKKEQEARLAQKELESKKAQQKVEAQMQLLKQEQNSAKLKVYFSVMNLYFHK